MDEAAAEAIIRNVFKNLNLGDRVHIAFQGGEPTVAGLPYFNHFTDYVKTVSNGVTVTYALQTNAVLINDEWCRFLKENSFLVGISLDGPEDIHNMCRIDADGNGTFRKVISSVELLRAYSVDFNILMTLTGTLARHPNQVWNLIKKKDFRYVQFTPCLAPIGSSTKAVYAITPQRFAEFYTQLFRLWKREFESGNYYSIKLFDDLISLLAVNQVNACGLTGCCSPQAVIEADGSVYPCDFYALDKWRAGNLCESPLEQIICSPVYEQFLSRQRSRPLCAECRYRKICNGACERMQAQICYCESSDTCGYAAFLDAVIGDIAKIAERERIARVRGF